MMALALLFTLHVAHADPGRVIAGATVGTIPQLESERTVVLRGSLDYGLWNHVTATAELGSLPDLQGVAAGVGPLLCPIDSRWWRVGIAVFPELNLPLTDVPAAGFETGVLDTTFTLRTGLRINWLAFWGLNVSGRLDRTFTFTGSEGWWEAGLGLAVRM